MRSDVPTGEAFTVLLLDLIDEAERDSRAGCVVLLTAIGRWVSGRSPRRQVRRPADLDRSIADLRCGKPGRGRVESIGAQRARSLVLAAIEASRDRERPALRSAPEPDERCYAYLPLLTCRMLGIPAGEPASRAPSTQSTPATLAAAWPASRRTELVEAFLAAHPHGWSHPATDRMFVERVVDASVEMLGFPPDRIGRSSPPDCSGRSSRAP